MGMGGNWELLDEKKWEFLMGMETEMGWSHCWFVLVFLFDCSQSGHNYSVKAYLKGIFTTLVLQCVNPKVDAALCRPMLSIFTVDTVNIFSGAMQRRNVTTFKNIIKPPSSVHVL